VKTRSELKLRLEPECTRKLRIACQTYLANVKWYRIGKNQHAAIAEKIINYLDNEFPDAGQEYMKLTSTCLYQALLDLLINLESKEFKKILEDEFKNVSLSDLSNIKISIIISDIKKMLTQPSTIFKTDFTTLGIKALPVDLKTAIDENNKSSIEKYLTSNTLTVMKDNSEYADRENLIELLIIAAIKSENYSFLKKIEKKFSVEETSFWIYTANIALSQNNLGAIEYIS
jgi:hypothetical protein